jgi:hypothetical protein
MAGSRRAHRARQAGVRSAGGILRLRVPRCLRARPAHRGSSP